jgi:hypothetical protein
VHGGLRYLKQGEIKLTFNPCASASGCCGGRGFDPKLPPAQFRRRPPAAWVFGLE